jgi:hypothetical protein
LWQIDRQKSGAKSANYLCFRNNLPAIAGIGRKRASPPVQFPPGLRHNHSRMTEISRP